MRDCLRKCQGIVKNAQNYHQEKSDSVRVSISTRKVKRNVNVNLDGSYVQALTTGAVNTVTTNHPVVPSSEPMNQSIIALLQRLYKTEVRFKKEKSHFPF